MGCRKPLCACDDEVLGLEIRTLGQKVVTKDGNKTDQQQSSDCGCYFQTDFKAVDNLSLFFGNAVLEKIFANLLRPQQF